MENIIKYITFDDSTHRENNILVPWNVGIEEDDSNGGFCTVSNEKGGWRKHLFNIQ